MALFSERMGLKPVRNFLQTDSMDDDLRNSLWNACDVAMLKTVRDCRYLPGTPSASLFLRELWFDLLKYPLDTLPMRGVDVHLVIRKHFFSVPWFGVYDFVEFVANRSPDAFQDLCNRILQREMAGYRFIGGGLAPITSEQEIGAVQQAADLKGTFAPVSVHVRTALSQLSDRQSPDYRNSIKESISAVEAMCQILTGNPKATLGQAIKKLESNGIALHPAFRDALSKLYGYTNDADGIRHALLEESKLDVDDAKFMLVACSAFANYLAAKSAT